jgi:hypothetical protein
VREERVRAHARHVQEDRPERGALGIAQLASAEVLDLDRFVAHGAHAPERAVEVLSAQAAR